jgi:hypothetical protein
MDAGIVSALLVINRQIDHAEIGRCVTPTNPSFQQPSANIWNHFTAAGRALPDRSVQIISPD